MLLCSLAPLRMFIGGFYMARYTDANCKLCRREGAKLFLKGERCFSPKCAFERRGYVPGQHGQSMRKKSSDYGVQLREKQKTKRIYGVLEKPFREAFDRAVRKKGIAGENLLQILESRLDNIVYRLGFAPSRKTARQLVRHGHFTVNERKLDVPSYLVKPGEVIQVREKSQKLEAIHASLRAVGKGRELPWLTLDKSTLSGSMVELPKREDIPTPVQEQLIVELYSK